MIFLQILAWFVGISFTASLLLVALAWRAAIVRERRAKERHFTRISYIDHRHDEPVATMREFGL